MNPLKKRFILMIVILLCAGIAAAGETLQQFGDQMGRSYHAELYQQNSCDACHDAAQPAAFPSDFVCLDCHDGDELIEATARPDKEKWQNPHNNMHYGNDVPCMECHGEHQQREMLCAGCHSFDYPNYKK